jgi:hypothetical protein
MELAKAVSFCIVEVFSAEGGSAYGGKESPYTKEKPPSLWFASHHKMLGGSFAIQWYPPPKAGICNYFFLVVFVPLPFLDPLGWGDPQGIDLTSYG